MTNKCIPANGGNNPINGLPICNHICVIYNNETLEILATAGTHNKAEDLAREFYHKGVDALASEIIYHDDDIQPGELVGMKMSNFQFFVDNYIHPLIDSPSTLMTESSDDVIDFSDIDIETDLDTVHALYVESGEDLLAELTEVDRNCSEVLDIALMKNGEFAGGFAFELETRDQSTELELTYIYVVPEHRGEGLANDMVRKACDDIMATFDLPPNEIKVFATVESDGGMVICNKVVQYLEELCPTAEITFKDENTLHHSL